MKTATVPVIAAIALVLVGCSSAPAPSATPTSSITPTTTSTPEVTETPVAATCETILTDVGYADLEADGLVLNPDIFVLDDTMQSLIDDGGLACYWTRGGGDIRVWFAQSAQTETEWAAKEQTLISQGWTVTDTPIDGVIQAPNENDDDYTPAMVYRDGTAYYASYSDFFPTLKAFQD